MFLLIDLEECRIDSREEHFNTSHVSINLTCVPRYLLNSSYFNTSHVSINLWHQRHGRRNRWISIHLMFLLIFMMRFDSIRPAAISIHLMFLLIGIPFQEHHPVKNFNTSHVSINHHSALCISCGFPISIHLMFLLIPHPVCQGQTFLQFQYISCFY